jgi:hypothetical protein
MIKTLLIGVVAVGAFFAGLSALGHYFADQADEKVDATLFTIRLVEQFVKDHNRWPKSWSELEKTTAPPPYTFNWPADSAKIQEHVSIDFKVNLRKMVEPEEAGKFKAIRPKGPSHSYRDSYEVRSLLKTVGSALR